MVEKKANSGHSSTGWLARLLGGSLRGQLNRSFVLIILLNIGLMAVLARVVALPKLNDVTLLLNRRQAFQLVPFFADAYSRSNSWAEAADMIQRLNQPLPPELTQDITFGLPWRLDLIRNLSPNRLILTDSEGQVVADSLGLLPQGQPLPVELETYRVPITPPSEPLGWLVVTSPAVEELVAVLEATLRQSLLATSLLAGAVALLLSFGLAQRLTEPIRSLSRAARALASGDAHEALPVIRRDEIGDLTIAFNEMTSALNRQKYLRRQMVADIAHELRTPLSVMQLDIEGLADGLQPPAEAAASLRDEIAALTRLVEDLRLLSLAEAGGLHFNLEMLELIPLLHQLSETWTPHAQARQVQLLTDLPADLPAVMADEGRLAQVFNNLLSNALRYTSAGGKIILDARVETEDLVVRVSDSGPGISAADLPFVFERFYRADSSRSRDTGGSGLGLAIARQWITLHGGRIWVESEPGQGAAFFVALPITAVKG